MIISKLFSQLKRLPMELMIVILVVVVLYQFISNRSKPSINKNISSDKFLTFFKTLSASDNHVYMLLSPVNSEIKLQYKVIRKDVKWWIELLLPELEWTVETYQNIKDYLGNKHVDFEEHNVENYNFKKYLLINLTSDLEFGVLFTKGLLDTLKVKEGTLYNIVIDNYK